MKRRHTRPGPVRPKQPSVVEPLEPRRLMAATGATPASLLSPQRFGAPLTVRAVAVRGDKPELHVSGTSGHDRLTVTRVARGLLITNAKGGWSAVVPDDPAASRYSRIEVNGARGNDRIIVAGSVSLDAVITGSSGDDLLVGGAGDDTLHGGSGRDTLVGGAGNDTLVAIDDHAGDHLTGGAGDDAFWLDAASTERIADLSARERAASAEHRVGAFAPLADVDGRYVPRGAAPGEAAPAGEPLATPRALDGRDLPDPLVTRAGLRYASFAGRPLFSSAGPRRDDVRHSTLANCYLVATLAAVAERQPEVLRQAIADLGDGTFAVRFFRDGRPVYVRVDADLAAPPGSADPWYAELGAGNSLWVALIEKAYTFFRRGDGDYASLEFGWMNEVFAALGMTPRWLTGATTGAQLLTLIQQQLAAGHPVTVATRRDADAKVFVQNHAYSVVGVKLDKRGTPQSVVLRNPWGTDGGRSRDGRDDGFVTVSATALFSASAGVIYA